MIARLVGVIHLPPLPGSPRYEGDWDALLRRVQSEAAMLRSHGFDLAMIENFGDTPFFSTKVPPVTVAAMTACAIALAGSISSALRTCSRSVKANQNIEPIWNTLNL